MPDKVILDEESLGHTIFHPHGHYEAKVDGRIVRSDVVGPVNFEMMDAYCMKVLPFFNEVALDGPFTVLTTFHTNMLMSPDTLEKFTDAMKTLAQNTPQFVGTAHLVALDVDGRDLMYKMFQEKVFHPIGMPYRMFTELTQAQIFLQEVLVQHANSRLLTGAGKGASAS